MAKTQDTMDGATAMASAPDQWMVQSARVNMRRDGKDQADYNLLLQDEASKANVLYHASKLGFDPYNPDGEIFVVVTVDSRTKQALRQSSRTHGSKLAVQGTLVLQDVIANKIQGRFTATDIGPVSLNNGGRAIVLAEDELVARRDARRERRAAFSSGR